MRQRTKYYSNSRQSYSQYSQSIINNNYYSTVVDDFSYFYAGETITPNDVVCIKDNTIYKATALSLSSSYGIGVSISGGLSGTQIPINTTQGKILNGFIGLVSGKKYFLSESNGCISCDIPQSNKSVVYQIGIAKSTTELLFSPLFVVLK